MENERRPVNMSSVWQRNTWGNRRRQDCSN